MILRAPRLLPAVCALTCATGGAFAQDKTPAPSAVGEKSLEKAAPAAGKVRKGEDAEGKDEADDGGGLQAAKFMPLGRPNLKVRIPQSEDGELQCVMNAEEMTRISDEDVDIKALDIELFEEGKVATRIKLVDGRYSLADKLISTDKRAVVQRADFTLVGESMEFDTVEQRGTMVGKVHMVIHDSSKFKKKKQAKEKSAAEKAGAAGLSVAEAARLIARVAAYQQRQRIEPDTKP